MDDFHNLQNISVMFELFRDSIIIFKIRGKKVKVFKKHIRVPLKTQNQYIRPLTHKEGIVTRHLAQGLRLPIDENIGCNAGDPVT